MSGLINDIAYFQYDHSLKFIISERKMKFKLISFNKEAK